MAAQLSPSGMRRLEVKWNRNPFPHGMLEADMRVETGGLDGVMAQQRLEHDQIHAGVQQVGGKAMTQRLSTMLIHCRYESATGIIRSSTK